MGLRNEAFSGVTEQAERIAKRIDAMARRVREQRLNPKRLREVLQAHGLEAEFAGELAAMEQAHADVGARLRQRGRP